MIKLRIGGVPEHFNLPVHLGIEAGLFKKAGIDLEWIDYPGGTGAMTKALRNDDCDICVLLTEGIITDIINGNPSKIISGYVKSPITWGIHTGNKSHIHSHEQVFTEKVAISRYGSGSHLMPTVDALLKGKKMDQDQYVTVQDIEGALKSLNSGETNIFYWEKYTTKPYVNKGHLRRIGEFLSPWPCFMIAARDEVIAKHPKALDILLKIIHKTCQQFMNDPEAVNMVSERYDLPLQDTKYWFHSTEWATDSWVSDKMLMSVLFTLKEAKIVSDEASVDNLVWKRSASK
ncbi:substrate-binding domain-containing protein [Fulvivirga aurantia]|uniref:substrate-binding domain-containing protein n=1 Tax=Fulvivirga aurantia TaxID=2529383 RepID=UPI001CA404B7